MSQPESPPAVDQHRLRPQGLQRVEVQAYRKDAALFRSVADALTDPERGAALRTLLLARVSPPTLGLKDLLAAAPLDDIVLDRTRDAGRIVDL